jgi:hypothetical protein
MTPATELGAFKHLLHDVASRVTGIGMTLDLLNHLGDLTGESAELVSEARRAADTLRHLIGDLGELSAFVSKRGDVRLADVRPIDLLRDLRGAGPSGMPPAIAIECSESLPAVVADRALLGYGLALLARASWRHNGQPPIVRASMQESNAVSFDVAVSRPCEGGANDRWPYDKPPYSIDHVITTVAEMCGGRFDRDVTPAERLVRVVLPVASHA